MGKLTTLRSMAQILAGALGTTKTTILRTVTEVCQIPFYLVEGSAGWRATRRRLGSY